MKEWEVRVDPGARTMTRLYNKIKLCTTFALNCTKYVMIPNRQPVLKEHA